MLALPRTRNSVSANFAGRTVISVGISMQCLAHELLNQFTVRPANTHPSYHADLSEKIRALVHIQSAPDSVVSSDSRRSARRTGQIERESLETTESGAD